MGTCAGRDASMSALRAAEVGLCDLWT